MFWGGKDNRNTQQPFQKDDVCVLQANEQWTALRSGAQYYMDMGNLMFDRSVAEWGTFVLYNSYSWWTIT